MSYNGTTKLHSIDVTSPPSSCATSSTASVSCPSSGAAPSGRAATATPRASLTRASLTRELRVAEAHRAAEAHKEPSTTMITPHGEVLPLESWNARDCKRVKDAQ